MLVQALFFFFLNILSLSGIFIILKHIDLILPILISLLFYDIFHKSEVHLGFLESTEGLMDLQSLSRSHANVYYVHLNIFIITYKK